MTKKGIDKRTLPFDEEVIKRLELKFNGERNSFHFGLVTGLPFDMQGNPIEESNINEKESSD